MSRKTSYNEIVAAIEAGERLTRAQGRSLLSYVQAQKMYAENADRRIVKVEADLHNAKTDLEIEKEFFTGLLRRWNAMIDMLHIFLGYKLSDEGGDIAEQYRQALEEHTCKRN